MNPKFERYFNIFREMTDDAVWKRYEDLYELWEFVSFDDEEVSQSVWEELHAIEMFLGIDDDPEMPDLHGEVETAYWPEFFTAE